MEQRFVNLGKEYELIRLAVPYYDQMQEKVGEILASYAEIGLGNEPLQVIEVGCGTGITTEHILRANERYHVMAIDSEALVIAQAIDKLQSHDRVSFVCRDAWDLIREQSKASFDVFVSACTLHNLSNRHRKNIIRRASKVLKPGGLFVNLDKLARTDRARHLDDVAAEITSFFEIAKAGYPQLAAEWVRHDLEDMDREITDEAQLVWLRAWFSGGAEIVYRQGTHAILTAIR